MVAYYIKMDRWVSLCRWQHQTPNRPCRNLSLPCAAGAVGAMVLDALVWFSSALSCPTKPQPPQVEMGRLGGQRSGDRFEHMSLCRETFSLDFYTPKCWASRGLEPPPFSGYRQRPKPSQHTFRTSRGFSCIDVSSCSDRSVTV